jgi:hypothetical protein
VPEPEQVPVAEAVVKPREVVDEVTEGQPFRVLGIYTDDGAENGITTVIIGRDDEVYSGADTKGQKTIVESIASATAKAMERMTSGAKYEIAAIDLVQENGEQVVSITGRSRDGAIAKPVSAARRVSDDLASAVAEATIHAFL